MTNTIREEFESAFPLNRFLEFNETLGRYVVIDEKGYPTQQTMVRKYNKNWLVWQAAKEQYAPMGSKIVAHLKQKLKDYVNDYAYTEPDTGATAFSPREAEEYAHHLDELIHEIETLIGDKE